MANTLHHVAVRSANFDQTVRFFQEVFQMEISRTRGDAPKRMLWFKEGIQINEVTQVEMAGGVCDHIGIHVDNKQEILQQVGAYGCKILPEKPHWFLTPDGIMLELMES